MEVERITGRAERAVLWDLDGTLADSSEVHWESWQQALASVGVTITREQFDRSFGQRNAEILPEWLGPGADEALVRRVGYAKEEAYRRMLRGSGLTPLPGAAEWVSTLDRQGWRQAIASSAPRANIQVMVEVLGLTQVESWVGAEDVSRGKPDPEVFLLAAARLGVPPDRSVVVEDAAAGIEAAHRAGIPCIGVGRGGLASADRVVASLDQLEPSAFADLLASSG